MVNGLKLSAQQVSSGGRVHLLPGKFRDNWEAMASPAGFVLEEKLLTGMLKEVISFHILIWPELL